MIRFIAGFFVGGMLVLAIIQFAVMPEWRERADEYESISHECLGALRECNAIAGTLYDLVQGQIKETR